MKIDFGPDWDERCADFGPLGVGVAEISSLEFTLDQFIWTVAERRKGVAKRFRSNGKKKRPPRTSSEKLDFVVFCLCHISELRTVRMYSDGHINLKSVFDMAEEVFDLRRVLARGSTISVDKSDGRVRSYTFQKYQFEGRSAGTQHFKIDVGYLELLLHKSNAVRRLLSNYQRVIESSWDAERAFKEECNMRNQREKLNSLGLLPNGMSVDMDTFKISFSVGQPDD